MPRVANIYDIYTDDDDDVMTIHKRRAQPEYARAHTHILPSTPRDHIITFGFAWAPRLPRVARRAHIWYHTLSRGRRLYLTEMKKRYRLYGR